MTNTQDTMKTNTRNIIITAAAIGAVLCFALPAVQNRKVEREKKEAIYHAANVQRAREAAELVDDAEKTQKKVEADLAEVKRQMAKANQAVADYVALTREAKAREAREQTRIHETAIERRPQKALEPVPAPPAAPADIAAIIHARALKKWPEEYAMQEYEIRRLTTAWHRLQAYKSAGVSGVPPTVMNGIINAGEKKWDTEYNMVNLYIEDETNSYLKVRR